MGFLIFLLVGLIAGALAKAVMPGTRNEPSGWIMTMVLGVVGAMVGGFLSGTSGSFSLMGVLFATLGAVIVIAVMRLITGRRAV